MCCNLTCLVINCDDIQAYIDGIANQLPQAKPAHPQRYVHIARLAVPVASLILLKSCSTLISELYYILADDAIKSNDIK